MFDLKLLLLLGSTNTLNFSVITLFDDLGCLKLSDHGVSIKQLTWTKNQWHDLLWTNAAVTTLKSMQIHMILRTALMCETTHLQLSIISFVYRLTCP